MVTASDAHCAHIAMLLATITFPSCITYMHHSQHPLTKSICHSLTHSLTPSPAPDYCSQEQTCWACRIETAVFSWSFPIFVPSACYVIFHCHIACTLWTLLSSSKNSQRQGFEGADFECIRPIWHVWSRGGERAKGVIGDPNPKWIHSWHVCNGGLGTDVVKLWEIVATESFG